MRLRTLADGQPVHKDDRVLYVSDQHGTSDNNPLQGTRHACTGTVTNIGSDGCGLNVEWDNGTSNSYYNEDLVHAGGSIKLDPNFAFKQRRRS